jgi:N-acetyl-alpha-D-muramate 1-phosphate uridylyltransferase
MFEGLDAGKRPLAPLLKQGMLEGKIAASKLQGAWVDVGTPERLTALDLQIREGAFN